MSSKCPVLLAVKHVWELVHTPVVYLSTRRDTNLCVQGEPVPDRESLQVSNLKLQDQTMKAKIHRRGLQPPKPELDMIDCDLFHISNQQNRELSYFHQILCLKLSSNF